MYLQYARCMSFHREFTKSTEITVQMFQIHVDLQSCDHNDSFFSGMQVPSQPTWTPNRHLDKSNQNYIEFPLILCHMDVDAVSTA